MNEQEPQDGEGNAVAQSGLNAGLGDERICDKEYIFLLTNTINEYASRMARMDEAARLIFRRHTMISGSLEMAECDAACKSVGLGNPTVKTLPSFLCVKDCRTCRSWTGKFCANIAKCVNGNLHTTIPPIQAWSTNGVPNVSVKLERSFDKAKEKYYDI